MDGSSGALAVCVITGFPHAPASVCKGAWLPLCVAWPTSDLNTIAIRPQARLCISTPDAAPPTKSFSLVCAALGFPLLKRPRSPTKIWDGLPPRQESDTHIEVHGRPLSPALASSSILLPVLAEPRRTENGSRPRFPELDAFRRVSELCSYTESAPLKELPSTPSSPWTRPPTCTPNPYPPHLQVHPSCHLHLFPQDGRPRPPPVARLSLQANLPAAPPSQALGSLGRRRIHGLGHGLRTR